MDHKVAVRQLSFLRPLSELGGSREQHIGGTVQRSLAGILDNADDEADTHDLHSNIVADAERSTGHRYQEQGAPDAPQAPTVATMQSRSAVGRSTLMPRVWAAARDSTAMVMAAPLMLMVAPRGMEME